LAAGIAALLFGTSHAVSAAEFDYYVLSLSWSPQYCAETQAERERLQCGSERRFAFVLHGLWPQDERGFPADCAPDSAIPKRLVDSMLDIMPSPSLVRYEWRKHGTCSGQSAAEYFATARRAFESITIPAGYRSTPQTVYVAPRQLEADFVAANPNLRAADFVVQCNGRYLREVRICLDRDLKPRSCGRDVRDRCHAKELIVRPVR
jgi:ribonuclease T2